MSLAVRTVAENRKARFNYFIDEKIEAGLALTGTEVKSLRLGRASIGEAYAVEQGGELYLINANIPPYAAASRFGHEPTRPRKLLLHRGQINKLIGTMQRGGVTVVPLRLYFNARGIAKLELGVARGKKQADKREVTRDREWQREQGRLLRARGKV